MTTILIVEDDDPFRTRIAQALIKRGYHVLSAATLEEALSLASPSIDRALIDLKLTDGSGLTLIEPLRARNPEVSIVMLTGYGSIATAMEAVRRGALHYLTKPTDLDDILRAFEKGAVVAQPIEYKPQSLFRAEWEHIQRVLQECEGNITLTAKLLGIPRRTLQRKLSKYPPPS